ncbi:MAG: ComEC/Rec2 family competence protein [Oscillospiraceae bacterium]
MDEKRTNFNQDEIREQAEALQEEIVEKIRIRKYKPYKNHKKLKIFFGIMSVFLMIALFCCEFIYLYPNLADDAVAAIFKTRVYTAEIPEGNTKIHFIDVGQGDCILLEQSGHYALIDAGEPTSGEAIIDYLRKNGVGKLDYFIMTHPHVDHIGSMCKVLQTIKTERIILPTFDEDLIPTTAIFRRTLKTIKKMKIPTQTAQKGTILSLGDGRIDILIAGCENPENINDTSTVLMFTAEDTRFLATGDGQSGVEKELLDGGYDIKADVLKAGHHGSITSNSKLFLQAVSPRIVVASCGWENQFGHPHPIVQERIENLDIIFKRTDQDGDVVVCVTKQGLGIVTMGKNGVIVPQEPKK